MALTRKQLKGMGLTDEVIDAIMEGHGETVDALKEQIKALKDGTGADDQKKEKPDPKEKGKEESESDGWKEKFEAQKKEFEDYKASEEKKQLNDKKLTLYKNLLKKNNISQAVIDHAEKFAGDLDSMEIDGENLTDSEAIEKKIKSDFAAFVTKKEKKGAETDNPSGTDKGGNRNDYNLASALKAKYSGEEV